MITPHRIAVFHLVMTFVWIVATIPTLIWLRDSVLWVSLMSLYAIVISHAAAYSAARADEKVDNISS